MWTPDSTWLSRLKLLDDLPLSGKGADLFELGPLVRLLAEAILNSKGPLVAHVDGTWGRGKTSFCRLVEEELTHGRGRDDDGRPRVHCSRYVASDDRGTAATSLLYAIAQAVAGPNDREEAARIVRQWGADEELSAMRVDGFATWLGHELGRSSWTPPEEAIEIPLGTGRTLTRTLAKNPERSAVVFVDDLDRCSGERVVEILDAIRSYVACPGLVFVIAADRRLIAKAFETIAEREADLRHVDAAEAMEKYIHRRVELPSFRGFRGAGLANRLRVLQNALVAASEPYLLSIPTANFEDGIALQLAHRFGASLTPRRLKRVLNDFAIDMAGFVDDAGLGRDFEDEDEWRELWVAQAELEPLYVRGAGRPARGDLRRYFVGRLLVRVAEHMWPSLFARRDVSDDVFVRRSERLLALARTHAQWRTDVAKQMRDELLMGLDPAESTPLHVRRELCEFMAVVFEAAAEASRWEAAVEEMPLGFGEVAMVSEGEDYVETLQQVAVPQQALVSLGDETYLANRVVKRGMPLEKAENTELDFAAEGADDEVDDEPADDPLNDAAVMLRHLEHGDEKGRDARRGLLSDLLFTLESLIVTTSRVEELKELYLRVLVLESSLLSGQVRSLWSAGRQAAIRRFDELAHFIYTATLALVDEADDLTGKEILDLDVEVLDFLVERQPSGEASLHEADRIVTRWDLTSVEADLGTFFELWLGAAKLHGVRPEKDFSWLKALDHMIEVAANAYRQEAGRENTRRYVLLLRAVGRDDPALDELFGPRATLVHAERGDPEIIEALADILVRRGDSQSYERAIVLYLRLRKTERWTPELLHNLATAEYARDPADDSAGAHWLEAYRRTPSNTVIRRAFRRFLLSRKHVKEAQMVSRGDPLPEDFAPFEDKTLINEEPTP